MSSDPLYLARTKSAGGERRAPPPIKPKPSTLTSPPTTDTSAVSSPTPTLHQQPSHVTVTANGTPASSSFGDLRKTFERQQNSSPLFMTSAGAQGAGAAPRGGAGLGASRGSTSTSQLNHHASISHVQKYSNNASQLAPSSGNSNSNSNNNNNNRPRSVSSPGPPLRDTDDDAGGIDNSQPDFGNLRARFQSQMSLSGQGAPKPVWQSLPPACFCVLLAPPNNRCPFLFCTDRKLCLTFIHRIPLDPNPSRPLGPSPPFRILLHHRQRCLPLECLWTQSSATTAVLHLCQDLYRPTLRQQQAQQWRRRGFRPILSNSPPDHHP